MCLEHARSNTKEPLISHEIPGYQWQNVVTDLFAWEDKDNLLTVDYYSNFFEVQTLKNTRNRTVIHKLKSIFARHGIPIKVIFDGGPQFSSAEFAEFAKDWDFQHVQSSPYYPQSNGLCEKMVGVVKRLFTKSKSAGTDHFKSLLEYQTTSLKTGYSPSQLLMGRNLRSVLPVVKKLAISQNSKSSKSTQQNFPVKTKPKKLL